MQQRSTTEDITMTHSELAKQSNGFVGEMFIGGQYEAVTVVDAFADYDTPAEYHDLNCAAIGL